MNTAQMLTAAKALLGTPEGSAIVAILEASAAQSETNTVEGYITGFLKEHPESTQAAVVAIAQGDVFHQLRVKLGFMGFIVDFLANDEQVTGPVQQFIEGQIAADIASGEIVQNATTGTLSMAPAPAATSTASTATTAANTGQTGNLAAVAEQASSEAQSDGVDPHPAGA